MVAAAMKAVFVIQAPDLVRAHWQRITELLRKQVPTAVPVMEAARDDVLAFLHFPQEHWRKKLIQLASSSSVNHRMTSQ